MRSKMILLLAVVMGLITTLLFFKYMNNFDAVAAANDTMTAAVTAKQAIKKNQVISPGMIEIVQVPTKGLHAKAVKTLPEAEGKMADTDFAPGEVLLSHHLTDQKTETLLVSRKVKEGYRAVSVAVNFVQSASNLIDPEDFVDVVYTPVDTANPNAPSKLLLENIRVLGVGRKIAESAADTPYVEYSAVTLEVKPEDLVTLVQSDEKGTISLALRSRVAAAPEKGAGTSGK